MLAILCNLQGRASERLEPFIFGARFPGLRWLWQAPARGRNRSRARRQPVAAKGKTHNLPSSASMGQPREAANRHANPVGRRGLVPFDFVKRQGP